MGQVQCLSGPSGLAGRGRLRQLNGMFRIAAVVLALVVLASALGLAVARPILGTVRVIDADTFDVGGTRVRLHGVDAAERDQTCLDAKGESWPCGAWATEQARALFEGRVTWCERLDTDRYGRAVARCAAGVGGLLAAKEGAGGVLPWSDVGAEVVGRGMAVAYLQYSDDYAEVEAMARAKGEGVFAGSMVDPAEHRAGQRTAEAGGPPSEPGCAIKGNVSGSGQVFHLPGGAFYERTAIDEAKGERWFCSPEEALAAGWRASQR